VLQNQGKIAFLEGLRGFAALCVVLHHFILAFYPALYSGNPAESHFASTTTERTVANSPLAILYSGNFAVCIFFVLSGFVLTHKFFLTGDVKIPLTMAVKRYPRLMLPVIASSCLVFGLLLVPGLLTRFHGFCFTKSYWWLCKLYPTPPGWLHFLKTTFISVPLKGSADYNTVLWTMGYEFKGSILLAGFCLSIGVLRKHPLLPFAFAFIFCFAFKSFYYLPFFTGAGLCFLHVHYSELFKRTSIVLGLTIIAFIIVFAAFPTGEFIFPEKHFLSFLKISLYESEELAALYHSIAATLLLFILLCSEKFQRALSGKFPAWMGRISFSMYLLHVLVITAFASHFVGWLHLAQHFNYHASVLLAFISYLVIVPGLSQLFYYAVDKQAMRIANAAGKKFQALFFRKRV
jgi:peptidoglycan/LPS O-acetylase OafA/YrhL